MSKKKPKFLIEFKEAVTQEEIDFLIETSISGIRHLLGDSKINIYEEINDEWVKLVFPKPVKFKNRIGEIT